jgi:hypothetical protein
VIRPADRRPDRRRPGPGPRMVKPPKPALDPQAVPANAAPCANLNPFDKPHGSTPPPCPPATPPTPGGK